MPHDSRLEFPLLNQRSLGNGDKRGMSLQKLSSSMVVTIAHEPKVAFAECKSCSWPKSQRQNLRTLAVGVRARVQLQCS